MNIKPAPSKPVPKLGLFHTAASHVPRFSALLRELAPELRAEHTVREDLLAEAGAQGGVDKALAETFSAALTDFAVSVDAVLCTCSTFGAYAERLSGFGKPIVRIDRPLAQAAVAQGSSVVIVAALESTLEPTLELFENEAARTGKPVTFVLSHAAEVWEWFERGDETGYLHAIAEHVDEIAAQGDVVALAQASMAGAEAFVKTSKTVLSSPRLGLLEAVKRL